MSAWSRGRRDGRRPGLDRNLLARGLDPTCVHRRWREGTQQSGNTFCRHPALPGPQGPPSSACPNICKRQEGAPSPGTRTTQTRPSGSCATWPGVWSMRNRASRAASWRGWRNPTVIRLGLPHELRRSLACTNIVENALARCARSRNVKRWDTPMASDGPPPACWRPRKPSVASRLSPAAHPPKCSPGTRKAQADSAIETIMKAA